MKRKVLFLDRDGTVIVEKDYLRDPDGVELEKGVVEGLRRFADAGFALAIVSNQSGIARGYFGEADLIRVNNRLNEILQSSGLYVASWHHCPHELKDNCSCRKPKPGMLDAANEISPIDWSASFMVGDKPSDVEAAHARGITGFIVKTGYGSKAENWARSNGVKTFNNLVEVAEFVLEYPF